MNFNEFLFIAGPCSVEDFSQVDNVAKALKDVGVKYLRGGAYKARTSPFSFQGLGEEGLKILRKVADKEGLKVLSEINSEKTVDLFFEYCDIVWIGSRNMQNFALLKEVAKQKKPVILKRGICSTIEEWLSSAEYIKQGGNEDIILCERGIRTFENSTRYTLDISSIPIIKQKTNYKIIVDPSHAAGDKRYVKALSLAAVAAGADGLMIEVHDNPSKALSDSNQQLNLKEFKEVFFSVEKLSNSLKKEKE